MIYFIQVGNNGPIKIGYTENGIEQRLASLQTASPYKLNLILTIDGNQQVEQELHNEFASFRTTGEWFTPSAELCSFIEGLKQSEFNLQNQTFINDKISAKKKIIQHKINRGEAVSLHKLLKEFERDIILMMLEKCDWIQQTTARRLGMTKSNLCQKIKNYGISIKYKCDSLAE